MPVPATSNLLNLHLVRSLNRLPAILLYPIGRRGELERVHENAIS